MSSIKKWKLLQKYATTISSDFIKKLYLKDGLLAIYKPYGIPVQTGPKVKHSITDLFPGLEKQYNLPNGSLELANRLDKNVAGVLLLTYEKKMAAQIALMQRDRLIEKKYLSILVGQSTSRFGTLKGDIVESDRSMKYKQTIVKHQVKPRAVTQFKILDNNMDTCMLCEFRTNTGYKHQVRLHASELLGCSILGDHKYHAGEFGPQPLSLRMMQLLRMEGVKANGIGKGKIRPWQRGLIPLHLLAQSVFIPGLNDGGDIEIKAEPPPYFRETMKNCNLVLNREEIEEIEAAGKKSYLRYRESMYLPKGLSHDKPERETFL